MSWVALPSLPAKPSLGSEEAPATSQSTAGSGKGRAGIKIDRRNINNLRHADDTTLIKESEEEIKSLLMMVKEESEKAGLKLNIKLLGEISITSDMQMIPL